MKPWFVAILLFQLFVCAVAAKVYITTGLRSALYVTAGSIVVEVVFLAIYAWADLPPSHWDED